MTMFNIIRSAIVMLVLFTLITGIAYPFVVTVFAQAMFHHQANGSVIVEGGAIRGSELIGQAFSGEGYFRSRPSATSPDYNAGSSSGSNLGPTNPDFLKKVEERIADLKKAHPDQTGPIPGDLVTASASGLDPHISPAAAEYQVTRVAKARGMSPEQIREV